MQGLKFCEFDRSFAADMAHSAAQETQADLIRQPQESGGVECDARALAPKIAARFAPRFAPWLAL